MIYRSVLLALFTVLFGTKAIAATGTIEICWDPGISPGDRPKSVTIPEGAFFDDFGPIIGNDGDPKNNWDLHLITMKPVTLAGSKRCVRTTARILPNSPMQAVDPKDGRTLDFIGLDRERGTPPDIADALGSFSAKAATSFR